MVQVWIYHINSEKLPALYKNHILFDEIYKLSAFDFLQQPKKKNF